MDETTIPRRRREVVERLYGFTRECERPVRSILFGKLCDRAWPIVEQYRSDLYHDALWIEQHVTAPCQFYFGADTWGTAIGDDAGLVRLRCGERSAMWFVEVWVGDGQWYPAGLWHATFIDWDPVTNAPAQ